MKHRMEWHAQQTGHEPRYKWRHTDDKCTDVCCCGIRAVRGAFELVQIKLDVAAESPVVEDFAGIPLPVPHELVRYTQSRRRRRRPTAVQPQTLARPHTNRSAGPPGQVLQYRLARRLPAGSCQSLENANEQWVLSRVFLSRVHVLCCDWR